MIMRKPYILALASLSLFAGCKDFSFMKFGEEPLAVVGNKSLYMSDIKDIFYKGITPEDSISLLRAHVGGWVKTQIKIQEAEQLFAEEQDEFDALIESYRNSLLIYKYDRSLSSHVDTVVTNAQMTEYYNRNKEQFRLVGPVVKARILAFPSDYRQAKSLKKLMESNSSEDYQDVVDIAEKSSFYYKEFLDKWYYFKDILSDIPFNQKDFDAFLKKNKLYEYRDEKNGITYLMTIYSYRNTGDYIPIDMISRTIRTAIINQRRTEYIKQKDDSLYNDALSKNSVSLNIDTVSVFAPSAVTVSDESQKTKEADRTLEEEREASDREEERSSSEEKSEREESEPSDKQTEEPNDTETGEQSETEKEKVSDEERPSEEESIAADDERSGDGDAATE